LKKKYFSIFIVSVILSALYFSFWQKPRSGGTIVLGTSLPQTGIMKEWGTGVLNGAQSYFEYADKKLLLHSQKIVLQSYDDVYEPQKTLQNTQKMLQNKELFALFGFVGTPTVKNILPLVDEAEIPLISPFTGASFLRGDSTEHIINFRKGYYDEIETIVEYLHNSQAIKDFAIFFQNDDYGYEGYSSLIQILDKKGLNLVAQGAYKRNTLSIGHAYNQIKKSDAQAVIFVGAAKANALFIRQAMQDEDFNQSFFAAVSFGDADAMVKNLPTSAKNVIYSQIVPSYDNTNLAVANEYRKIYKNYCATCEYGFISFEAFIAAKIVVRAVNKLQNTHKPLTRKNFIKALQKVKKEVDYFRKVRLFRYSDNKFLEIEND
jgi:ABC-type branched-subunit amino acid transport system substrate-binding protein